LRTPLPSVQGAEEYLRFVGRRTEMADLRRSVKAVRSGYGGATVVVGEPGIGKSRLLAAVGSDARSAGLPTLVVAPPPHPQPWTGADPPQASDWPDFGRVIDQAARAERLAIIADDIHLSRPDQLPALSGLLDLTLTRPVLLIMAYRPRQIPCALGALLTRASDIGILRELRPGALSLPEARELLGDRPDFERIHQLSAGNPLYLQALTKPWGTASVALLREVSALSLAELQTAQTAAALGDQFPAALLAAAAPADAEQTLVALDRLVAVDIVRPADPAAMLGFRHPVLARIIYDHTDISQRRAIHLRIESALAKLHATAARRAHHVARAAFPALPGHVETLLAGAGQLLEDDPATAASWLTTACALMAESDPRWAEAQLVLARTHLLRGSPEECRRLLQELLPRVEAPHLTAAAAVYYGQANRLLGRPREARALFETELAHPENHGPAASVIIHTEVADLAVESADFASAKHHTTIAADIARSLADRTGEASALSVAALAHLYAGETETAQEAVAMAARLVDGTSDAALIRNLGCLNSLGMAESALEHLSDAERHLSRGLVLSRRHGHRYIQPYLLKTLAEVRLRQGNVHQARDTIAEARVTADRVIALSALVETMHAEALLWLCTSHDPTEAVLAAEHAIALCDGATDAWAIASRISSADILIRAGQPDRGSRLLTAAAGGPLLLRLPAALRARWWESLVVAAVTRGDGETAERLTQHALADPGASPTPARRGYILRAQMHTAGLRADTNLAVRLALSAGEYFDSAHMRLEVSRTLVDVTRICLDAGSATAAGSRLDDAQDLAHQCGSPYLLDEIEDLRRQLDKLTVDSGADTRLSDRELQVAMLASTGMRSKDIASQLFVSVRTIDTHLGRIYRKLGISTRTELVRGRTAKF
jgi:DNA-binding CsgD family transcriptional regulator/tetratricopeptide (TPR) repeat protein